MTLFTKITVTSDVFFLSSSVIDPQADIQTQVDTVKQEVLEYGQEGQLRL